jgi:transcriptional regulator
MITVRDQQVVLERDRGDTIVEIGSRHGISHQRVSVLVARATEVINKITLDLMVARKTDEVCVYVIPYSEHYTLALDFSTWLIKKLRDDGTEVDVEIRRASNGIALLLTDVTPRRARTT